MPRKSEGKTGRKRVSARRQLEAKVKASDALPPEKIDPPENLAMPDSPIAEWLLDRSDRNWQRLQVAASLGRLTKADLQCAVMVQLKQEVAAFDADPEGFESQRKAHVNRQRLLRSALDVVKQSVTSGPMQVIRMVWPSHEQLRDIGEDVRLEVPDERG